MGTFFSDNLIYLRYKLDLSQQKIADKLEITRGRYSKYEEGNAEPPIWLIVKISSFFEVTIDDLVKIDLRKSKKNAYGNKNKD